MDADPWNWTIQDVQLFIKEHLTGYVSDLPRGRVLQLDKLSQAFEKNGIDGAALLSSIEDAPLQHNCAIPTIAQRNTIMYCVNKLRAISAGFAAYKRTVDLQTQPQQLAGSMPWMKHAAQLPTEPIAAPAHVPLNVSPSPVQISDRDQATTGTHIRTGEIEIDDERGRKRRKLNIAANEPEPAQPLVNPVTPATGEEYFGDCPLPVDDLFYGGTPCDSAIEHVEVLGHMLHLEADIERGLEDENFQFLQQNKSSGEVCYVYSKMLHFMNTDEQISLRRHGREAIVILPYRKNLVVHARSATVLQFKSGTGEAAASLKEICPGEEDRATIPKDQVPGEWDFLLESRKADDPVVLTIYGHSESDELAEETTLADSGDVAQQAEEAEEDDTGEPDYPNMIDSIIQERVATWTSETLPKLEHERAWTIWKKMKQSRSLRQALIEAAQARIDHLSKRLRKMTEDLLRNIWRGEDDLRLACGVMDPTIEDREEQKWMIDVWRRKKEPHHVVKHAPKVQGLALRSSGPKTGKPGLIIQPYDRFSISPEPMQDDLQEDTTAQEVQYDASEEDANMSQDGDQDGADLQSLHAPSGRPSASPSRSDPFVVRTPDPQDMEVDAIDAIDDGASRHEPEADLPVGPLPAEGMSDHEDQDFVPDKEEGYDSDLLPEPSTFIRTRSSIATPTDTGPLPIDLTGLPSDDEPIPKKGKRAVKMTVDFSGDPKNATAAEVEAWDMATLVNNNDRQRILIKLLYHAGPKTRNTFSTLVKQGQADFAEQLQAAATSDRDGISHASLRKTTAESMMRAANFFLQWSVPRIALHGRNVLDKKLWSDALNENQCTQFTSMLRSVLIKKDTALFRKSLSSPVKAGSSGKAGSSSIPIRISSSGSEQREQATPSKRSKKKVIRSAAARDSRVSAYNRQQKYLESQHTDPQQLAAMILSDPTHTGIEINPARDTQQDAIYICDRVAKVIKPHQVEGVRFLWREITADGDEGGQGCVLAHTMGLGKTMQSIALLAAVNEAAASKDSAVRKQLHKRLRPKEVRSSAHSRQLRVLIMTPPALLENWSNEINQWAPHQLGNVLLFDAASKQRHMERLNDWMRLGGVLLIGYQMFRSLLSPRKGSKQAEDVDSIKLLEDTLLKGPEIVVADEAHVLKNPKRGISSLAGRFDTQSRIALTGTPMSNDVDEMFALVTWVAPGFLGDSSEFNHYFAEPIKAGLYAESSYYQRRQSIKKLKVLQAEIDPKIHRANYEVLRGSLPPKVEYVITVALQPLQVEMYGRYIRALQANQLEKATQVAIFGWLARLTLLANHPRCFARQLRASEESKAELNTKSVSELQASTLPTDSGASTPVHLGQDEKDAEVSDFLLDDQVPTLPSLKIEEILQGFEEDLDPTLSTKVTLFLSLLEFAHECGDKVLVFSSSIPTLNYLDELLTSRSKAFGRIDGSVAVNKRMSIIEQFHAGKFDTMLISTRAGGVGLNIQGANRVFIFDFGFNPAWEEQAIGRAYRLGQQKPVYVYRFMAGGTFETNIYNKQIFKSSLAQRVIDKKNPHRFAERNTKDYLYPPRDVMQEDLMKDCGSDPKGLDRLLLQHGTAAEGRSDTMIRAIKTMETLQKEAMDEPLNEEEQKEVDELIQQNKGRVRGKAALLANGFPASTAPAGTGTSFGSVSNGHAPSITPASLYGNRLETSISATQPGSVSGAGNVYGNGGGHAHPMGGLPILPPHADGRLN